MKKTLFALLMMAGVSLAGTEKSVTLSSYYAITSEGQTTYYDTVENFYGKTLDEIKTLTTTVNKVNWNQGLTWDLVINTGDLHQFSGDAVGTTDSLQLTSLVLTSHPDLWWIGQGRYVSITLNNQTYTADQVFIDDAEGDKNRFGKFSFDFSKYEITFKKGDQLTFTFASTEQDQKSPVVVFDGITGPENTTGWYASAQINAKLVPEPATATLSLLALAGLAARRRRR